MKKVSASEIRRIIVRGTNWVGDAMMTIPALRELRLVFPHAHITLATRSWAEGLFRGVDFVDEVYVADDRGIAGFVKEVRAWRRGDFDLAVLLTNSFASALTATVAGVPFRIGYATDARARLLTHPIELPDWRSSKHEVFYYLKIVAELEWLFTQKQTFLDREPNTTLCVSSPDREAARELLKSKGVLPDLPVIAICPGSINSRAKRWPAESFAVLADRCIDSLGAQVLLIGSRAELDVSQRVADRMHNRPVVLTGETDIAQLASILSISNTLVTNDTGPAHISAALGTPTIVIFGPTNPLTTRPFSPVAEIVRRPPDCAPCMLRDCPIDHRCMTAISPDEVFERVRHWLSLNDHQPPCEDHFKSQPDHLVTQEVGRG